MRQPEEDAEEREEKGQRAVQSVEVGGRLLLALGESAGPMSLKDLAAAAGLPPSRAHPYLVSYAKLRLVEQDPGSGRYALGPAALQLGLTCLQQLDPVRVASDVGERLAAATGHAVALAVWGNFGPTIIRMLEARQALHVDMRAGTVMSILDTATGKAFAATLAPERVAEALARSGGSAAHADGTVPSAAELSKRLAEIGDEVGRHGVARAAGFPLPGVNAFSAAARNHEGAPVIVITSLGHQDRFPADWGSPMATAVRAAAGEISARLGWRAA